MKFLISLALTTLITPASVLAAECDAPQAPAVPDGASASYEQMIASKEAIQNFQADNRNYLTCMEQQIQAAANTAKTAESAEERSAAAERHTDAVNAFNAAISQEEQLAGEFNSEIKAYQAAQAN